MEKNELIGIEFSHSDKFGYGYFMYVVRTPNIFEEKYYYKVFEGVLADKDIKQDFIDDIANYGNKFSTLLNSVEHITDKIRMREKEEVYDDED